MLAMKRQLWLRLAVASATDVVVIIIVAVFVAFAGNWHIFSVAKKK